MRDVAAICVSALSLVVSGYTFALQRSMRLFREGKRSYIYRKDRP